MRTGRTFGKFPSWDRSLFQNLRIWFFISEPPFAQIKEVSVEEHLIYQRKSQHNCGTHFIWPVAIADCVTSSESAGNFSYLRRAAPVIVHYALMTVPGRRTLDHLTDITDYIRLLLSSEHYHLMLVQGPPGWGKSSLTRKVLGELGQEFRELGSY